jgi:tetratricopeptide (TPR) repeat protein
MKHLIVLLLLSTTICRGDGIQGAFRYHEAHLLERRITKSGEDYGSARTASYWGLATPSPAQPFVVDPNNPNSYRNEGSIASLLSQIDHISQGGRRTEAERQYHNFLTMLRRAQGPNSIDEAFVLDDIAAFYLRTRDFDRAYRRFGEAVKIGRLNIAAATAATLIPLRLHLADMLTKMGELDLARGESLTKSGKTQEAKQALDLTEHELSEAVAIDNQQGYRIYVNRLDGPYFEWFAGSPPYPKA